MFSSIITLVFLSSKVLATDLAAPPQSTMNHRYAPRQVSLQCGLSLNAGGSVSLTQQSGHANLCLQCRVDILGVVVGFTFFNQLSESINQHGVSVSDAAVLQGHIQSQLNTKASQCHSQSACSAACALDRPRCQSSSFHASICTLQSVNFAVENTAGAVLASAFNEIYLGGGSTYCSLCSQDRCCAAPSARARRSLKTQQQQLLLKKKASKCPEGLTACPISFGNSRISKSSYECLDVSQEIDSCGGCATTGEGTNCSTAEGVKSAGCARGKCHNFSCNKGYMLSKKSGKCIRRTKLV